MRRVLARLVAAMSLQRRLTSLVALCAGLTAALGMVAVACTGWWLQQERAREDTNEVVLSLAYALQASLARRKGLGVKFSRRMGHVYPRAIELVQRGLVDVRRLATHHFPLAEAPQAFAQQADRRDGVIKSILHPT